MKRILLIAAFTLSLGASTSAQILNNGSFEDAFTANCDDVLFSQIPLSPWVASIQGNVFLSCLNFQASHGQNSISLGSFGFIYQDLPTAAGVLYQVTFDMSGFETPDVKTMTVTADGGSASNYEYRSLDNTADNMNWSSRVYSFTAADDSTQLRFTSTTFAYGAYQGAFIDNIASIAIAGLVCHRNNGSGQPRTMNLTEGWAFWAHTQHGDQIGACP